MLFILEYFEVGVEQPSSISPGLLRMTSMVPFLMPWIDFQLVFHYINAVGWEHVALPLQCKLLTSGYAYIVGTLLTESPSQPWQL